MLISYLRRIVREAVDDVLVAELEFASVSYRFNFMNFTHSLTPYVADYAFYPHVCIYVNVTPVKSDIDAAGAMTSGELLDPCKAL